MYNHCLQKIKCKEYNEIIKSRNIVKCIFYRLVLMSVEIQKRHGKQSNHRTTQSCTQVACHFNKRPKYEAN